jgi:hypothetical protein
MKIVRALAFFAVMCAAVVLFGGTHMAHASFGVSPPFVTADHLIPGITYTQTIYLVQDQLDTDLPIKATLSIPDEVASWISIDKGFSFVIPKGARQFPVTISITIPKDATLGKWNGGIAFTTAPSASGQVTIALGVRVAINFTVGNGIYEQFSVPLITFPDIEEGWNPTVDVRFNNQGNISEAFDAATFEIFDVYDTVRLAYIQKQDGFPETKPFSTNEYTVDFPTTFYLGVGDYWGSVVFYQNGKVVASQKAIFHVLPVGSIAGVWGRITHFWKAYQAYLIAIIIILVVAVVAIWYRRRRIHARAK